MLNMENNIKDFVQARFGENEPLKVVIKNDDSQKRYLIQVDEDIYFEKDNMDLKKGDYIDVTDYEKNNFTVVSYREYKSDFSFIDVTDCNNLLFSRDGFDFIEFSGDRKFVLRAKENGNQFATHSVDRDYATSQGHYFYYGKWNGDSKESAYNAAKYDLLQREMDEIYKGMNSLQRETTRYAGDVAYINKLFDEITALKIFSRTLVHNVIEPYGERDDKGCELVKNTFEELIDNRMYSDEWKNLCMDLLEIDEEVLSGEEQEIY